jgi:hypothetical protein
MTAVSEYRIPLMGLTKFNSIVDRANKIAVRCNQPLVSLVIRAQESEERVSGDNIPYWEDFVIVELQGAAPVAGDYSFVGSLQHNNGKNVFRALPGQTIPETYRIREAWCDVCQKKRQRNDTFVIQHRNTGEFKQVGTSCLSDLVNGVDPHALASLMGERIDLLDQLAQAQADGDKPQDSVSSGVYSGQVGISLAFYLAHVVAVSRKFGWVSAQKAKMDGVSIPTSRAALDNMHWSKNDPQLVPVTRDDFDKARNIIAFFRAKGDDWAVGNEYKGNLLAVLSSDRVQWRHLSLAASAVGTYDRENAPVAPSKPVSEWVGSLGDKLSMTVKVTSVRPIMGDFGQSYLTVMEGAEGQRIVWFASKEVAQPDQTITVVGTVKKHNFTPRGDKETVVTRCRLV